MSADTDLKILVIDDSSMIRLLIVKHLNELGLFNVDVAENGIDAKKKIDNGAKEGIFYNLVFCDWNMPGLNGEDTLKTIRSIKEMDKSYVAILSADFDQNNAKLAKSLGANIFLTKPFGFSKIKTFIDNYLKNNYSTK